MICNVIRQVLAVCFVAVPCVSSIGADDAVTLFDGKSLKGWKVLTCEAVVEDEAILLKGGNGLVQTEKQYEDYVFEYEWKALKPDAWDSGVYFRFQEVPDGRPWPEKYQVNLRKGMEGDLVGFKEGKNPIPLDARKWNRFELTVRGSKASLKVNGREAWEVEGIQVPRGYIALQAEIPGGGQFLFRNVKIQELKK